MTEIDTHAFHDFEHGRISAFENQAASSVGPGELSARKSTR
jgi:hypothetical protein